MNTKYFVLCAAALVMFAACQKEENAAPKVSLTASLEQQIDNGATKTALGTGNTVVWSEGDQIKVHGSTGVEELTLTAGAGTTTGSFGTTTVNAPDYAIYPSSAYTSIAGSTITFNLPATQTYAANSFGNGANVAVAKIEGGNMAFNNVCGALKLQLKGSMKVAKIELTGKNNEKLNGAFTVDAAASPFVGAVKTTGDPTEAEKKVTLDCTALADGGVQIDPETATVFNIIVPVGALNGGFEAIIYDVAGDTYKTTLSTAQDNTIERSVIVTMPSRAVSLLPADFKELNYVESSGPQYIKTGINANNDVYVDIKFKYTSKNTSYNRVFGTRGKVGSQMGLRTKNSDGGKLLVEWLSEVTYSSSVEVSTGEQYRFEMCERGLILNDIIVNNKVPTSPASYDQEMYLFTMNFHDIGSNVKVYYFKMFPGGSYARYFVPAKVSKADGVTDVKGGNAPQGTVGMYDVVNGKFYTNDGEGSFTAGPELTD